MLKIGIGIAGVLSVIGAFWFHKKDAHSPLFPSKPTLPVVPRTQAALVYFEYEPDPQHYADQQLKLRLERRTDGQLYLKDEAENQGRTVYYALNGSVNQTDARRLSEQPILPNRWIHLVKYITEVANVNTESWLTSAFNVATGTAKYAASAEVIFWVRDSLQTKPAQLPYTQPLWPHAGAMADLGIFKQTPAFVLPPTKKYGSESMPVEEPIANLKKVSWNVNSDKFRLLYAGDVMTLMQELGAKNQEGITRWDSRKLDQAADWLARRVPSQAFAVDFEPANPQQEGWAWDYRDASFRQTMYALSERIYRRHGKLFYSWIGESPTFDFQGKTFNLDGLANDSWSAGKKTLDDYLAIHQAPQQIQNAQSPSPTVLMTGFGYTSSTVNTTDAADQPAHVWKAPVNWYLRTLDMLNLKALVTPANVKFLTFLWPYEDKPADARRSHTRRFRLGKGYVRQIDNRVMYPMNLVRDALFVHLCHPRVFYTNYWLFGQSYQPQQALRYAHINGRPSCLSVQSNGYLVYEYTGPDAPPCPTLNEDYMGKDALGVAAMVQAHEMFARYQNILDGTQVAERYPFGYQRGQKNVQKAVWQNDTGEFARAFKHTQPWLQVWRHPKTNKRLLLWQDPFAEAFEPVTFSVSISGKTYTRTVTGNQLHVEVI
ncbi:MAG: hypothetical protein MUE30_00405 [Spirosomaceae bacterium]|nr:hypothetical protein [Spirosomataceae bacterium]